MTVLWVYAISHYYVLQIHTAMATWPWHFFFFNVFGSTSLEKVISLFPFDLSFAIYFDPLLHLIKSEASKLCYYLEAVLRNWESMETGTVTLRCSLCVFLCLSFSIPLSLQPFLPPSLSSLFCLAEMDRCGILAQAWEWDVSWDAMYRKKR